MSITANMEVLENNAMTKPLVTILTAPKPFIDPHISVIQTNALISWKALGDAVDVIVLGNDPGIKENMDALGVRHFPDVACNEKSTPLISSMLEIGRKESTSPVLAIVNADIILFPDFIQAVSDIARKKEQFLLIGQRWDMDVPELVGHTAEDFAQLKERIAKEARLHPPSGSDYFAFPRSCFQAIPDFAIGRAGWDNWFIYKGRWEGWPVVDASGGVTIIHQDHDYAHLPGGKPHYRLPETKQNITMGGGDHTIFSIIDSNYKFSSDGLRKVRCSFKKFIREVEIFPLVRMHSQFLGKAFFYLFHPKKGYLAARKALKG